jgi:cytosine/adenosine deaminase-related metal-dependent hydrolase
LVVHGNYLADDELQFLATHPHMTLVYCPRTHAYFGHAPHPWRTLQLHGGRVILGTDSRASNPDLDLFAEAKFLAARHPQVDPAELLAMITRQAAEALFGERSDIGVLEPGRRADLVVLRLPRGGRDPWERLFDPATEVVATLSGGRWSEAQPARGPCRM